MYFLTVYFQNDFKVVNCTIQFHSLCSSVVVLDFDTHLCSQLNRLRSSSSSSLLTPARIPPSPLGCGTTVKGAPWKQLLFNSGKLFLSKKFTFQVDIYFVGPKTNPFSYFS